MTDSPPPALRLAYLTGEYPAVSHTFILREVTALRALGLDVRTFSIRRTGPEHHRGPAEQAAAASTFNVLEAARDPMRMAASLAWALRRPRRLARAAALAWRTRAAGAKALVWQLFYLLEAIVLARQLRHDGITHLHNHFAMASCSVAMLAAELAGLPFSFTLHGPADFFEARAWRLDEKIARARFVACISHFCRSQAMIHADPRHWNRLAIVHCGVEPGRYARDPGQTPGQRLLFVGRLAGVKGVPVLIQAFAPLVAQFPGAELVLAGDGPERPAIEAQIRALGLTGSVRMTGYLSQDQVAAELARTDVFVLPSFAEGVPVVLMEAMAAGLPVIATRIAGIPELVADGQAGLLVPPGDAASLGAAIAALLADPARRQAMGAAGRQAVLAGFDVTAEAARLAALFRGEPPADRV